MEPDRPDREKDWWWTFTWLAGLVVSAVVWALIG
jgi:hypothetical protein